MAFDLSRPPSTKGGSLAAQYGQMMNQRQPGGMSSISSQAKKDAFVNTQRGKFFDGRKVPEERVFKRTAQDTADRQFKDRFTRPAGGSKTNLLQMTPDAPRSLAAERERLANIYGPTFSEIMGDINYATGEVMSGIGRLPNQLIDAYKELSPVSKVVQGIQNFFKGPSQIEAERLRSIPRDDTMSDQQKTDTQISSMGASPDFLAAINDPLTMAREFNLENLLNQARALENLGNTNLGKFGIEGFTNPTFTFDKPIGQGNLFFKANPSKNLYDLGYTMTFANGGVANL